MVAYNVVRYRVRAGQEEAFLAAHDAADRSRFDGFIEGALVDTGARAYCFVGKWERFDDIAAARPAMIAWLDTFRQSLEDLGDELGVTDPVSGTAVKEF
jgi:hypothetical protein